MLSSGVENGYYDGFGVKKSKYSVNSPTNIEN